MPNYKQWLKKLRYITMKHCSLIFIFTFIMEKFWAHVRVDSRMNFHIATTLFKYQLMSKPFPPHTHTHIHYFEVLDVNNFYL
jgi:hypothetical protein